MLDEKNETSTGSFNLFNVRLYFIIDNILMFGSDCLEKRLFVC